VHRNRLLLLAGAVAAAGILVVVLIIAGGGGGGGGGAGSSTSTTTAGGTTGPSKPARSLFAGIPQHGDTLGRADATATLTVFEDPQCPFCREWALGTLPGVIRDDVRTGRIKLVYRGVEVIGPDSERGLRAIYAAGSQNKLWDFAEALYRRQGAENSGWITDSVIRAAARAAGARSGPIMAALSSAPVTAALRLAAEQANADHVNGTPTFVVQHPPALPQQLQLTALDPASFGAALDAALP
jgi:protein-disulfide isomerase